MKKLTIAAPAVAQSEPEDVNYPSPEFIKVFEYFPGSFYNISVAKISKKFKDTAHESNCGNAFYRACVMNAG
jgi:hypothetical protein